MKKISLLLVLLLVGCDGPGNLATDPVMNLHGQTITFVAAGTLPGWLKEHRKVKVISICGAAGESGNGFIVVYENKDPNVE